MQFRSYGMQSLARRPGLPCQAPVLPTEFVSGYDAMAGRLWTTILTVQISRLVDVHLFDPLKNHLAGKRFTTDAEWSKLSPPAEHRFLLRRVSTAGRLLKHRWGLHGGLMCTVCCPWAINMYTSQSEYFFVNRVFVAQLFQQWRVWRLLVSCDVVSLTCSCGYVLQVVVTAGNCRYEAVDWYLWFVLYCSLDVCRQTLFVR